MKTEMVKENRYRLGRFREEEAGKINVCNFDKMNCVKEIRELSSGNKLGCIN